MAKRFRVETYYKFKKAKNGVCLGMTVEADDIDDAIEKARAECIGSQWPSRIYVGSRAQEEDERPR